MADDPLGGMVLALRAIERFLGHGLLKIFVYLLNQGEGEEHVVAAAFHRTCP
jgi:hypothetical protein